MQCICATCSCELTNVKREWGKWEKVDHRKRYRKYPFTIATKIPRPSRKSPETAARPVALI